MNNWIFQLTQILSKHPWLILIVMFVAAGLFFVIQPPKSRCDTLLDSFQEKHAAWLAPAPSRAGVRPSQLQRQISHCKQANSPGGCFDLFMSYRLFLDDFAPIRLECTEALSQRSGFKALYQQLITLLVQIAWGDGVPDESQGSAPKELSGFGQPPPATMGSIARSLAWLETADLALFCRLNREYIEVWGAEDLKRFSQLVLQGLPGDLPRMEKGECVNCETRRNALQVLPLEQARARSLFSLPCQQFL